MCLCVCVSGIFHIRRTIFSACLCACAFCVFACLRVCVEFIRRAPADAEEYQKGARSSVKRYTIPCTIESKTQGDIAYIQTVMQPHPRTHTHAPQPCARPYFWHHPICTRTQTKKHKVQLHVDDSSGRRITTLAVIPKM